MSSSGAKSLILVSRYAHHPLPTNAPSLASSLPINTQNRSGAAGIDEHGRSVIAAMEERGTRVSIFSVDVSDMERVVDLLREVEEAELPPLRGIVQSSMILEDCLAVKSSLPKYFRVSDPKVCYTSCSCYSLRLLI